MGRNDFIEIKLLDYSNIISGNAEEEILHRPGKNVIIYVLSGGAVASTKMQEHFIKTHDLLTVMHGSDITLRECSEGFRAFFISYGSSLVCDADLLVHLRNSSARIGLHPVVSILNPAHIKLLESYCSTMYEIIRRPEVTFREEITKNMLEAILFAIDGIYRDYFPPEEEVNAAFKHSRTEETANRFNALVLANYMSVRSPAFYAGKLCISPKYLAYTIKEVTGCTPSQTISEAVVMDAKSKLKSTSMSVGEISESLNFPNPSFFCKYFKRHTGISPAKYRNTLRSQLTCMESDQTEQEESSSEASRPDRNLPD